MRRLWAGPKVQCEPKADRGLGQVHRSKAVPGSARCRRLDRDGPIRDTPSHMLPSDRRWSATQIGVRTRTRPIR
jgi:hypothetical protein